MMNSTMIATLAAAILTLGAFEARAAPCNRAKLRHPRCAVMAHQPPPRAPKPHKELKPINVNKL